MVLSFGEMLEKEAPKPEIWLDDDALHNHFERLKEKRRQEGADADDDNQEWEENAAAVAVLKAIGERR